MILLLVNYLKPLDEVDRYLSAHRDFLQQKVEDGIVIVSGSRNPRTGGIILCRLADKQKAVEFVESDPFYINGIAEYDIIEFNPAKHAPEFDVFLD